jgi:hypothetical protein
LVLYEITLGNLLKLGEQSENKVSSFLNNVEGHIADIECQGVAINTMSPSQSDHYIINNLKLKEELILSQSRLQSRDTYMKELVGHCAMTTTQHNNNSQKDSESAAKQARYIKDVEHFIVTIGYAKELSKIREFNQLNSEETLDPVALIIEKKNVADVGGFVSIPESHPKSEQNDNDISKEMLLLLDDYLLLSQRELAFNARVVRKNSAKSSPDDSIPTTNHDTRGSSAISNNSTLIANHKLENNIREIANQVYADSTVTSEMPHPHQDSVGLSEIPHHHEDSVGLSEMPPRSNIMKFGPAVEIEKLSSTVLQSAKKSVPDLEKGGPNLIKRAFLSAFSNHKKSSSLTDIRGKSNHKHDSSTSSVLSSDASFKRLSKLSGISGHSAQQSDDSSKKMLAFYPSEITSTVKENKILSYYPPAPKSKLNISRPHPQSNKDTKRTK